jgi:hypothetical protein
MNIQVILILAMINLFKQLKHEGRSYRFTKIWCRKY